MGNAPLQQFAKRCCTRQHLTPEEWGILEDCTRLTRGGERPFICSGRDIADRFSGISYSTVYRAVRRLVKKGWFVKVGGGDFNPKTGLKTGTIYHVISHEEWVKIKGRTCVTRDTGPVSPVQTSSVKTGVLPVSRVTHKPLVKPSVKTSVKTSGTPQLSKSPFLQEQESRGEAHDVRPSSVTGDTGACIPDYAEYDATEKRWVARRDLGRGTTAVEVEVLRQLTKENARPQ